MEPLTPPLFLTATGSGGSRLRTDTIVGSCILFQHNEPYLATGLMSHATAAYPPEPTNSTAPAQCGGVPKGYAIEAAANIHQNGV